MQNEIDPGSYDYSLPIETDAETERRRSEKGPIIEQYITEAEEEIAWIREKNAEEIIPYIQQAQTEAEQRADEARRNRNT